MSLRHGFSSGDRHGERVMEFMHSSIWLHMPSKMFRHVHLATVLAVGLFVMAIVPHPVQAGPKVERYSKTPEAQKINVNLLRLDEKVRTEGVSLAAAAASMGIVTVDSGVMLDILVSHLNPSVKEKFLIPGVTVRHFSTKYNRVSVVIDDPSLLYELAKIPEVRRILPEYGGTTGAVRSPAKAVPRVPGSSCGKATSGGEELPPVRSLPE